MLVVLQQSAATILTQGSRPDSPAGDTPSWQGRLELHYDWQEGATRIGHSQAQAPLKLQRPFYPEGPAVCHTVMLHTAGGIVGGDRLVVTIQLAPQAQALVTTPAASKIYRSNGREAQQAIHLKLAAQTRLEWFPQEAIIFNQALYRQTLRVDLAPTAEWLGWEIHRFGRTARGEAFVAGDWRSHTEVWQGDRPLWLDRQWLPGDPTRLHSPHGLAGFPVIGTFAWVGPVVTPELVATARHLWSGTRGEGGVTRLPLGLVCRYRGHSSTEARQWFTAVWQMIRQTSWQRPVCLPRVWS